MVKLHMDLHLIHHLKSYFIVYVYIYISIQSIVCTFVTGDKKKDAIRLSILSLNVVDNHI